ncbi:MAG: hypothetical protein COA52_05770 [Hyphomicrobiales bacterium]|nr:MAG: hypothetical protein COA52_05770 [Hyphomicrobiales bacterium]
MTLDEFNDCCGGFTAATKVVQWGGSHVWKIGGKIFAISELGDGGNKVGDGTTKPVAIAFKCSDMSYRLLPDIEGIIPAPYLARAKWVRVEADAEFSDEDRQAYMAQAHKIISTKLTKKLQKELGLN